MAIQSWTKCKNCGGDFAIHHYKTNQCPVGGREASVAQKQEWKTTVFEAEPELPKEALVDVGSIRALTHERNELAKFVRAFLDNFKECPYCTKGIFNDDSCRNCHGTGRLIDSVGILYVDLPNKARKLLGEG